jgi:hypothetical protein
VDDQIKIKVTSATIHSRVVSETKVKSTLQAKINYTTAVFEWVPPPVTRDSLGLVGQQSFDNDYYYICVAPNLWARQLLMKGW